MTNMIAGLILIITGILFPIFGISGTAKIKIKGWAGFLTMTVSGVGGIILIVFGAMMLLVPP
jgi:hypothetical protein